MKYLNKGVWVPSASKGPVLIAGTGKKLLLKTVHVTNVTSSNAQITLDWDDDSENELYTVAKDVVIPVASSFQAIDGTFILEPNDRLSAQSDLSGSLHITVSYMEIDTPSEG